MEQTFEEAFGGFAVPASLHQDVEHDPALVHCAPQIMQHAPDPDEHLIEMPRIARLRSAPAQPFAELGAELSTPMPNTLVARVRRGYQALDSIH